ncbi:MAG: ROK family protein [Pseudomonadales bacterium]|nr:ROK family protein [Pseudomonadales bacterium]
MKLGIDLGGTKIEAIVLDSKGVDIWRKRVATPGGKYEEVLTAICQLVADAKQENELDLSSPVGIGTPGALTLESNSNIAVMKNCNSTVLNGRPLLNDLIERLCCTVHMANDANCFALAEALSGQGKEFALKGATMATAETVFGVILGTGVGGGIVVNGKVLQGINSIAGEWGHNPMSSVQIDSSESGRLCYCGRINCVETFLSGPGLSLSYKLRYGDTRTPETIIAKMRKGDPAAVFVWRQYMQQLSVSLAQVVNLLDPSLIVLGGGLSAVSEIYDELRVLMAPHVFSNAVNTTVLPALLGDSAGVYGAAWLTG